MSKKIIFVISLSLLIISCNAKKMSTNSKNTESKITAIKHDISMYPKASENFNRYIISLPKKENELTDYKVELFGGKTIEVDCNQYQLFGSFKQEDVKGWGYPIYTFISDGKVSSTLKGCPDNKKEAKFIQSKTTIIRYNSKLPIVVYAPKEFEIKYAIWGKQNKALKASIN